MALSKLFISYRSLDSGKVDTIKTNLTSDRTVNYSVWQDKDSIPGGQDWWDKIVQGIENCDIFVFAVSRASIDSVVCRAELNYAYKLHCRIIPVVLQGEFFYDAKTGKNDIDYWNDIPKEISNDQFLFQKGSSFYAEFKEAISEFELTPKTRLNPNKKPPHPISGKTDIQNYQEACIYASNLEFEKADQLFRTLIDKSRFSKNAQEWITLLEDYQELMSSDAHESTRYEVPLMWETYKQKFPKSFITLFDPKNFEARFAPLEEKAAFLVVSSKPLEAQLEKIENVVKDTYRSLDDEYEPLFGLPSKEDTDPIESLTERLKSFLPTPFDWCYVPQGIVYISGKAVTVPAFMIGKYTITNQQFDTFIKGSDGYVVGEWWAFSKNAIYWRSNNITPALPYSPLSTARFQASPPKGKGKQKIPEKNYPRTNVNWYEAMAFCRWLSDKCHLDINLPTPQQWQRAAKGDRKFKYAWGEVPDPKRARYSLRGGYGDPAEVTEYEFGAGPFGVLSMCGNVHEWTQYLRSKKVEEEISFYGRSKTQTSTMQVGKIYGGSHQSTIDNITCSSFIERNIDDREKDIGFRVVLNLEN